MPDKVDQLDELLASAHFLSEVELVKQRKNTASGVLQEAAVIVAGARETTHGDKERSFEAIANLWQVYLESRRDGGAVTAIDVANMMVLLKMARSIQGTPIRDHFVDMCGYACIAGELHLKGSKP